jgi:hypothetical protein
MPMAHFCSSLLVPVSGKDSGSILFELFEDGLQADRIYVVLDLRDDSRIVCPPIHAPINEAEQEQGIVNTGVAAAEAFCSLNFIAVPRQRSQQFGFGYAGRKRGTDALAINVSPVGQCISKKACSDVTNNRWAAKPPQSLQSSYDDCHTQQEYCRSCGALTRQSTQGIKTGPNHPLLRHGLMVLPVVRGSARSAMPEFKTETLPNRQRAHLQV